MIITVIILLGLILVTVGLGFRYNWKLALGFLVPLIYASYYVAATEIPKRFGYAIALNFSQLNDQARFISGFEGKESIFILLIEKGASEPRLISVPLTEENKKVYKELQEQVKSGKAAVLKKASKSAGDKKGKSGGIATKADIEQVELKDQDIISKDQE